MNVSNMQTFIAGSHGPNSRSPEAAMLSNTHFSLAVHVLSALAYNEGKLLASEQLARSMNTNPSFLRGLVGQLRDAGLVATRLGKGGGMTLARPADRITLLDVYRATEHGPALTTHTCDQASPCPVAQCMDRVLGDLDRRLEETVSRELQSITLAGLVGSYLR
jgi:Rrf2 family protein